MIRSMNHGKRPQSRSRSSGLRKKKAKKEKKSILFNTQSSCYASPEDREAIENGETERPWYKWKSAYKPPSDLATPNKWKKLRELCLMPSSNFSRYGEKHGGGQDFYFYKDNGADILAVAHLDTVQDDRHFGISRSGDSDVIWNCQLDDRLGAWMILELFPSMGIKMDVLLTTDEEMCNSTARFFSTAKSYNWIAEFDRAGTDAVTYGYENPTWLDYISKERKLGRGSYSDIYELESLGVSGVNWGVGYSRHHMPDSQFSIREMEGAASSFVEFHRKHKNTKFPHVSTLGGYSRYQCAAYSEEAYGTADTDPYSLCEDGLYEDDLDFNCITEEQLRQVIESTGEDYFDNAEDYTNRDGGHMTDWDVEQFNGRHMY